MLRCRIGMLPAYDRCVSIRTGSRGVPAHENPGYGARWRRGQAPDAADGRPRQTRRPLRWHLPTGRLRPLEPRQRRLFQDRRPDAVQKPQSRSPHRSDLASERDAEQLRRLRAGTDAAWSALVRGIGRRDLPEPQPRFDEGPDYILVFGADHIYRMDPR